MAQKVNIILVDDLDGSEATETVTYGLDGVTYEIDLNDEHATELRSALEKYVGYSRRVGGRATRKSSSSSTSSSGGDKGAIREWAKANGFEVSERGRIPEAVQQAYDAAQKDGGTEDKPKRSGARRRAAEVSEDGKVKAS